MLWCHVYCVKLSVLQPSIITAECHDRVRLILAYPEVDTHHINSSATITVDSVRADG